MYKIGTVKVAWTSPNNYNELNSRMFNSIEDAQKFATGMKDYMIMRLIETTGDSYQWEVLPYGNYPSYKAGMIISKNIIIFTIISAALGYGLYRTLKTK